MTLDTTGGSPNGMKRVIRGLYPVTPDEADTALLREKVAAALRGGISALQYRNKTAPASLRLTQARVLLELCRLHGVPLIVNDHVDLALAIGADGVHLGGEDGAAPEARAALGPNRILGISCYDQLDFARIAQETGADYVAFGSFFPSSIKPDAVRPPLSLLTEARTALTIPVVAIGGITLDNAAALITHGATGVAVISALFAAPDIERAAQAFSRLFSTPP